MTPPSADEAPPLAQWVHAALAAAPVYDIHTHLFPSGFGRLMSWGIDDLLTYHYLIAEAVRAGGLSPEAFYAKPQREQADYIWRILFVERAPISEACRGVATVLHRLGLPAAEPTLEQYRDYFKGRDPQRHVDDVLRLANVRKVVMTNDPFDPAERKIWMARPPRDPRFEAALRVDPLLLGWPNVSATLRGMGYDAADDLSAKTMAELRRFLNDWIDRMGALYAAVSLPPTWSYPDDSPTTRVIDEALLPVLAERDLPLALMIGVTRQVNPRLRLAGDMVGRADVGSLLRLCERRRGNKFLVTMLSRENQHELAAAARKFANLMVFGCWWFLNNPSLIEEITTMRLEMLGPTFIPQHSDARVLEQVIYKWDHSRAAITRHLSRQFANLAAAGWPVTQQMVDATVADLFGGNFERFLKLEAN